MELFENMNPGFKGKRYCSLFSKIVKKFDFLGLIDESQMDNICGELSFVSKALSKSYDIIFKRGLTSNEAIRKLSKITDKNKKPFIDLSGAKQIYDKFQQLNNKSKKKNKVGGSAVEERSIVPYIQPPVSTNDVKRDGSDNSLSSKPPDNSLRTKPPDNSIRTKPRARPSSILATESNGNVISNKYSVSNLRGEQKQFIDKSFDMMEILLICLSLLPLAGWSFDVPLLIYALSQKKYTLAMVTVLNWYIWAFWLIFGVNVNMGPVLKASYLGNTENVVKKTLLFPQKQPSKVLNPFTQAHVKKINDEPYLIDINGNVFSAEINSPTTVGIIIETELMSKNKIEIDKNDRYYDKNRILIDRWDSRYEPVMQVKKEFLKKDKVGP